MKEQLYEAVKFYQHPNKNPRVLRKDLTLDEARAFCNDPDELNASTQWLAYDKLREWNLEQDIEQVAESKGLTLEKWQVETIKHRYYKLDDETWEQLSIIMDDMKGE